MFPLNLSTISASFSTELVRLSVSHKITAECFKQVTLNCDVATSTHQLSIKHMEWSQGKTSLCSVDSEGEIITHPRHSLSEFHCVYEHGQLSLIFQNVQPLEGGESKPYRCKLQSNKGATHNYTTVELQGQNPHLFLFRHSVICLNTICKTAVMNVQNTRGLVRFSLATFPQLQW